LLGIRTLAEELVVIPNTVAKAYCELEHDGHLELRQGSGASACVIEQLREEGLLDEEIKRAFEAV
jgi:GntR family transcriptional regulator